MDEHGEQDGQPRKKPERKPKAPRKLTARYLENAALHYLKRYAATESGVRRVLTRKVERSLRAHGGDRKEALGWVDELVKKLARNGLVNDETFAEMKAASLRASGRSARVIALKLRMKGVPDALVAEKLSEATDEVSEEQAARTWARKKRLGPFRRDLDTRKDNRQRDLAALARAGFDFDTARKVIDAASAEASDDDAR